MRLLLDTQIYLWFLADSKRLSRSARQEIAHADEVMVSAASIWEASIKIVLGKLEADTRALAEGIAASGFAELPIRAFHGVAAASLPDHHRDPFDRMLLAQAMTEPLYLLTADAVLARYSPLVRVV